MAHRLYQFGTWKRMSESERKKAILLVENEFLPENELLDLSEEQLAHTESLNDLPENIMAFIIAGLNQKGFSLSLCKKKLVM
ncbi:MAG TPA: hypothetical protein VJH70_02015 [Candidatus Paceibacterota bacterium]